MSKLVDFFKNIDVKSSFEHVKNAINEHSGIVAAVGAVTVVAGTVLACKATVKMEQQAEKHTTMLKTAKDVEQETGDKTVKGQTYGFIAREYIKTYAPSVLVLGTGIALLLKARGIEVAKNKELTAAYIALEAAFKKYREEVKARYGEDEEKAVMNTVTEKNEHLLKCADRFTGVDGSIFVFNETSQEFEKGQPRNNALTLVSVNSTLNSKLNRKKIVYLNDLMRLCGHKELINGWEWCWYKTTPGTDIIKFDLDDRSINDGFINGTDDVAKIRLTGLVHVSRAFREGIFCEEGVSGELGTGPITIV